MSELPPATIFGVVLAIFIVAFASYFGYQHYKSKRLERQQQQEQQNSVPMQTPAQKQHEEIPVTEATSEEEPANINKHPRDSHSDLLNVNHRQSIYDADFYVSKDRGSIFRGSEDVSTSKDLDSIALSYK